LHIIIDAVEIGPDIQSIGENNADNVFDSTLVAADRDGSLLERSEFLMDEIADVSTDISNLNDDIDDLIASQLILNETGSTKTTDGTEQTVYINNAPTAIYAPKIIRIDFTNQTAAETVIVREYYRIKSGGNYILVDEVTFAGVQDPELIEILLDRTRYGIKVTMERTAGNAIDYDYESIHESYI